MSDSPPPDGTAADALGARDAARQVVVVADREFRTVLRTPGYLALALGFVAATAALARLGTGGSGYAPLALDLLAPFQVLVPLLALAFGHRALLDGPGGTELDVVRTFPVSRGRYAAGVFVGRGVALVATVGLAVLAAGLPVALAGGRSLTVLEAHATVDTPLVFVRFFGLAALFALVLLAVALAASALAGTRRQALAVAVVLGVALVVGFDAGTVAALAGGVVGEAALPWLLAASPVGAFRGLVLDAVVGAVAGGPVGRSGSAVGNALGLFAWGAGALLLAARTAWRADG
ncbi:MAG: copper ABC transporter permease [Halobacteriaceae archaeon]